MSDLSPDQTREMARLAVLRGYGILDTPNEPEFDRLVRRVAHMFNMPIALISFLDETRSWFKARYGLDSSETPSAISFCTHAIKGAEVFIVPDATLDERFACNPLVTGHPHIRFTLVHRSPRRAGDGSARSASSIRCRALACRRTSVGISRRWRAT